jgi:23S rRNA (guanosine2251-2'-O)-methyltransferase
VRDDQPFASRDEQRPADGGGRPWEGPAGRPPAGPRPRYGAPQRGRPDRPWERDRRPTDRPAYRGAGPDAAPIQPLGEDEELVAGRRPVEESFVAGREAHRLLVVPQRRHALEQLVLHATRLRIPIVEVEGGSLTALAGFDGHQGIALVVGLRRMATIDDVLARSLERGEPPFVLVLDSLEDPQNLGTLLRSAEAAGVHGVLFPTRRQAPLTPSAIKASAGAVEHLLLCPVDDLAGALADLHARGLRVAGAEEDAPLTARQTDLRGPLALVVGSEGQGLGPAVRRRCDTFMRIPMRGAIGSLNAAVAGSILLFEAVAQRDPDGAGSPPRSTSEWSPAFAAAARTVAVSPPAPTEVDEPQADAATAEAAEATARADATESPEGPTESDAAQAVPEATVPDPSPELDSPSADAPAATTSVKPRKPRAAKAPVVDAAPAETSDPPAKRSRRAASAATEAPTAEAATTRKPRRSRAGARAEPGPSATASDATPDSAEDDLLPGGPPADVVPAPPRPTRRRATPRA